MKELETFLQNLADGLRSLAGVFENLADKTGQLWEINQNGNENQKNTQAVKVKADNDNKRRKIIRTEKATTAAETIFQLIKSQKAGIDTSDLIKETNFEEKKVRNIIYKLKKQNKIKTAKRGIYVVS
jgi:DNA replicative helicase MCM subunit Mcm2 (Cdc46/Mcm family)